MGIIKSAFEKAMERADAIAPLTPEEKERLKYEAKVKEMLSSYFRRDIDAGKLWKQAKDLPESVLPLIQEGIIGTLSLRIHDEDFKIRKEGILGIESLKKDPRTPLIENALSTLESLSLEFQRMIEDATRQLKEAMEQNPQLRMKPVMTPDGKTALQPTLSVDEAVEARLSEFIGEHEKQYETAYQMTLRKLKQLILV